MITKAGLLASGLNPASIQPKAGNGAVDLSKQFGNFLDQAMANLNDQQAQVDQLTKSMATGDLNDVSQLMIASEKSALGLQLTVQVRNKVIEAYQEIMRMQL